LTMQPGEDQVALGAVQVGQHAEDFHVHRLRLHSLKYGVGDPAHTAMNVANLHHLRSHAGYGRLCRKRRLRYCETAREDEGEDASEEGTNALHTGYGPVNLPESFIPRRQKWPAKA